MLTQNKMSVMKGEWIEGASNARQEEDEQEEPRGVQLNLLGLTP